MRLVSKISAVALAAAAAAVAVSAQAQSIDVRVVGVITPAACTPTISGGGVVDYGNIPASSLNITSYNKLPEREVPISISCDAPTRVAIRAVDNRASSVVPEAVATIATTTYRAGYGLGTVSGANVGGYVMRMKQGTFTLDGVPGFTVFGVADAPGGGAWLPSPTGLIPADQPNRLISWSGTSGGNPATFTNLAGTLSVEAVLNKGEALPLTDEVPLDGLATIEMLYL